MRGMGTLAGDVLDEKYKKKLSGNQRVNKSEANGGRKVGEMIVVVSSRRYRRYDE